MATSRSPEPVYTPGTARGARLASLLIDEGTSLLRTIFEDEIRKMKPPSLRVQLKNHGRYLCSLRYLNPGQRNKLYPRNGDIPNSAQEFDVSMLELLLKELCRSAPYADARRRLRLYRNTNYGHISSTELSEEHFDRLWQELADILVALGGDMNAISERLNSSIDPEKEKKYFSMLEQLNKEDKEVKDILLAHGEILKRLEQRLGPSLGTVSELSGASGSQMAKMPQGSVEEGGSLCKQKPSDDLEADSDQGGGPSCRPKRSRESEDEETDETGNMLRSALTINYSNTLNTLKPLPWDDRFCLDLGKIFTSLVLVSQHGDKDRRILNLLEDVFDYQISNDQDRRFNILVDGHAGSGKSTLLTKTAFDWSCKKGRLADMKKIVLLVRLREVEPGESIAEIVWDQCVTKSAKGVSVTAIETCLQENESRLVFLLDGYDELVPNAKGCRQAVPELLAKKWYPNSTVIVTSRPLSGIEEYMAVDCKVEVAGFSSANVDKFATTYFKTISRPDLAAPLIKALQANIVARSLIQTPMFIMLICVLWEEDPDRVFPGTVSGLYQELLTCVIRKHCVREGLSMSGDKIPGELSPILLNLGKLALESLLRGESLVDLGKAAAIQETDILLKLGIVSKEVSASRLHPREQLNFSHKTMQEFLAGRFVAHTVNTSSVDLHKLVPLDTVPGVMQQSNLVVFICGCGGKVTKEMLTKLNQLHEDSMSGNYTFSQGEKKMSDSLKDLCLMNLYEGQNIRNFQIVSAMLSSLDLTINIPSREGAALMYYLQHAAAVPEGRLLRLTLKEESQGDAVEYLSVLLENSLHDLCLYLTLTDNHIYHCHIGDKLDKIATFLQRVPCIRSLSLEGTGLTPASLQALRQILPNLSKLEKLDLSDNIDIGNEEISLLITGLVSNLNLTDLNLQCVGLEDVSLNSLAAVLHHLSCLENLDISQNNIGASGLQLFGTIHQTIASLKVVHLVSNNIGDVCLKSLASVLHHLSHLEKLDLSYNNIGNEAMEPFAAIQQDNASLKVLYLSHNKIGDVCLKSLAGVLHHLPSLEFLHLCDNKIGNEDMEPFAAIQQPVKLKELYLQNNKIGDVCLKSLAGVMHHLSFLEHLYLSENNVGDDGMDALSATLHHAPRMEVLELQANTITEVGIKKFAQSIQVMSAQKQLYLGSRQTVPLDDTAAMSITKMLTRLPMLERLDLVNISMPTAGFQALLTALEKHTTFETLGYTKELIPQGIDIKDIKDTKIQVWLFSEAKNIGGMSVTQLILPFPFLRGRRRHDGAE